MSSMMKNRSQNPPRIRHTETKLCTDENESWDKLYDRIRVIALRKSAALLCEEDVDEAFDRGARALRTLMGAAEVVRRMKLQDEKDSDLDDRAVQTPVYSDEEIRRIYRDAVERVEKIALEEEAGDCEGSVETGASGPIGGTEKQGVDEQCS